MNNPSVGAGPSFSVRVDVSADRGVLVVTGDLDLATVEELGEHLARVVDSGCRELVVDLTAVPFCDVVGFTLLLDAARAVRARRGSLRVLGACWSLRRMVDAFDASGLLAVPSGTSRR